MPRSILATDIVGLNLRENPCFMGRPEARYFRNYYAATHNQMILFDFEPGTSDNNYKSKLER